ncbi:polysaccharide deacetylase family protein [Azotobacter salinestris]|uniref:polysaccharide deacetylase family protein n=1 Tax=Azotobacter salinestris TaxID=69964 RepID=UPI0012668D53|nr:polysaccharide deacetylase family protein [Azotobacter salinestris]
MALKQLIKAGTGWLYLNTPAGRRLLRGSGTILMLHRVLAEDARADLPHRKDLCIGTAAFDHLLHWLGQHFECVPLAELLDPAAPADGPPRLALTFDDGWRDNALHAFPLLRQHRMPASIFLSTDFIGSPRRFWWEAIGETLWGSFGEEAREQLCVQLRRHLAPPAELCTAAPDHSRSQALGRFLQRLKSLPATTLQVLANSCPNPPEPHALDWQQVREMEDSGLVRFGPHGASHAILTGLDDAGLQADLRRSHEAIAAHCRHPLPVYCYPNGDHDGRVCAALACLGYSHALSTRPGLHHARHGALLSLPRIGVCQHSARQPALLGWRILQGAHRRGMPALHTLHTSEAAGR